MKDTFKMSTSSQVQKNNDGQALCSTRKCYRDRNALEEKATVTNLSKNPDQTCSYVFFPTWHHTFFSLGLYILFKQVLDSMMDWTKIETKLSSEGQSTFTFMSFFDMHHLLPNSEFCQLQMSTSIAGFSFLSYASVKCKNNSEGIFYMYTYPLVSTLSHSPTFGTCIGIAARLLSLKWAIESCLGCVKYF